MTTNPKPCIPGAYLCAEAVALWDVADAAYRRAQRRGYPDALWAEYEAALKAYHAHVETCATNRKDTTP